MARFEALAAIAELALRLEPLERLLSHAVRRLARVMGAEFAGILELDPHRKQLAFRAQFGWPPAVAGKARIPCGRQSQEGFTLLASEPVILEDLQQEKRFRGSSLTRKYGIRSGLSTTIDGEAGPFGVLAVHTRQIREFTTDDAQFLKAAAGILASAIRQDRTAQALRESDARMRAIVTTAVDAIITIDERGIIDSANPAAERLFGYDRNELAGRNVSVLMPEPYRSEHDDYIARYLRTGKARIIGIGREVIAQRKDGTTFPINLAVSEFRVDDRRMFTGIIHDLTDRRRLERRIIETAEAEQRRIGQDLHDGLCQHLTGIAFALQVLSRQLAARSAPEASAAARVQEMVDSAITQARQLARSLQPVEVVGGGLLVALKDLAAQVTELFNVSCVCRAGRRVEVVDPAVAGHLYRIAQEAVSNAVKHGRARSIVIDLQVAPDQVALAIHDDGIGLSRAAHDGKGLGLRTMAYRAHLIGGHLNIRPGDRGGTSVTCVVRKPGIGVTSTTEGRHGTQSRRRNPEATSDSHRG
ncbi:MAG: PAS domain S-box protein [Phycisphaerae bacterium]|nr:PAS domain S-box protein [Phycisphaerae bacterium]